MFRGRTFGIVVCSVFLVVLAAAPALGHAELESASPAEGETLEQAPSEVRLDFGEPVEAAFSPIEVYDSEGNRVDEDDGRTDPNDASVVVASLQDGLQAGSYTVRWSVTSADGDPVSGEYSFEVGAPSGAAAGTTQEEAGGGEDASGSGGGELSGTGGAGSIALYAGLAIGVIALLGISLRGRLR